MSNNKNQELGREFEQRIAKELDLSPVKGSGNQVFHKLDVEGKSLLISCKWTAEKSYRLTNYDINEVVDATVGIGGKGQEVIPIIVTEIEGKKIASLPLDTLIGLIQSEAKLLPSTPSQDKYKTSSVPALLRD